MRYVALLRGINVGGNKLVPMAQLKTLLSGLGYGQPTTLLQSGNAVFTSSVKSSAKVEKAIETALLKTFGFEVSVVVRTSDAWKLAVGNNPFPHAVQNPSAFLVYFLSGTPEPAALATLTKQRTGHDEFRVVGQEIYAQFPDGIRDSKLAAALVNPKLGVKATGRNWNTVLKLQALLDGA